MSNYWNKNLKRLLKSGNKVEMFFNEGNRNNKIIEVREVVDEDYIVYRVYDDEKEEYDYHIQYVYFFYLCDRENNLSLINCGR